MNDYDIYINAKQDIDKFKKKLAEAALIEEKCRIKMLCQLLAHNAFLPISKLKDIDVSSVILVTSKAKEVTISCVDIFEIIDDKLFVSDEIKGIITWDEEKQVYAHHQNREVMYYDFIGYHSLVIGDDLLVDKESSFENLCRKLYT